MVIAKLFESGADIFGRTFRLSEVDRHQPVKRSAKYLRNVDCMQQMSGGLAVYKVTDFPYGVPLHLVSMSLTRPYILLESDSAQSGMPRLHRKCSHIVHVCAWC